MTKNQINLFVKINEVLKGENLNDCNHALAAAITYWISQCIGPIEYRENIMKVTKDYADWFYDHRREYDHLKLEDIPFEQNTTK